jgi:hypothetical protein
MLYRSALSETNVSSAGKGLGAVMYIHRMGGGVGGVGVAAGDWWEGVREDDDVRGVCAWGDVAMVEDVVEWSTQLAAVAVLRAGSTGGVGR